MGGCDHSDMRPGELKEHLRGMATTIKEIAARLAADKVLNMSTGQQHWVSIEAIRRGGGRMENAVPIPPDHGYSWLPAESKQIVDEWRNKYNVDLLTFDAADKAEAENKLNNEHLTWIEDQFDRAGNIPCPKDHESHVTTLSSIAGEGELVEIEQGGDGTVDITDNVTAGESLLGNSLFNKVSVIQDQTQGWESATATTFKNEFLPKVPTSVANQVTAAKTLRNLLAAHQGVLTLTRRNLDNIAHDGKTSAESFDECCPGGDDTETIVGIATGVFTVVGGAVAIAGGIAALPAAGAGAGAIAGGITMIVGGASALQAASNAPADPDNKIGGDSIEDVIYNIKDKVSKTFSNLDEAYEKLKGDGMGAVATDLVEGRTKYFSAPRPDGFADSDRGNVISRTRGELAMPPGAVRSLVQPRSVISCRQVAGPAPAVALVTGLASTA